jgi:hypothetical protein
VTKGDGVVSQMPGDTKMKMLNEYYEAHEFYMAIESRISGVDSPPS